MFAVSPAAEAASWLRSSNAVNCQLAQQSAVFPRDQLARSMNTDGDAKHVLSCKRVISH